MPLGKNPGGSTSDNQKEGGMRKVRFGAIAVPSDLCLFTEGYSSNPVKMLSIYGAPQQVKAVASALLGFKDLENSEQDGTKTRLSRSYLNYRFRSFSLGYGKCHGLIWEESDSWVFWTKTEDRFRVFEQALSKRKIPYQKDWIPQLEEILTDKKLLQNLSGWGGGGYDLSSLDDDEACDLIVSRIVPQKSPLKKGEGKRLVSSSIELGETNFFPKAAEKKLCSQFKYGSNCQQQEVVAKILVPGLSWTWYAMNMDPEDLDYLWGFVDGDDLECGPFSLSELRENGAVLDLSFTPAPAVEVWERLNAERAEQKGGKDVWCNKATVLA
jgi:hypothetical protein